MNNKNKINYLQLLSIFFIATTLIFSFLFYREIGSAKIDYIVVLVGNSLLFLLSIISFKMHVSNILDKNPNVFLRGVMTMNMIKMLLISVAIVFYLVLFKEQRNKPAIFIFLALYLVYATLDTIVALRIAKQK